MGRTLLADNGFSLRAWWDVFTAGDTDPALHTDPTSAPPWGQWRIIQFRIFFPISGSCPPQHPSFSDPVRCRSVTDSGWQAGAARYQHACRGSAQTWWKRIGSFSEKDPVCKFKLTARPTSTKALTHVQGLERLWPPLLGPSYSTCYCQY